MDYKYIEQLLERYWACETDEAEERILRDFFAQENVPAHLVRYQALFDYARQQVRPQLSKDFDERVCALAEASADPAHATAVGVKARPLTTALRLRPLFRAAASVAIVLLLGNAAQRSFNREEPAEGWDYNSAAYTDSYENPQTALDESMEALKMVQDGLKTAAATDSLSHGSEPADAKSITE